jgi:2'-phosphotransferase
MQTGLNRMARNHIHMAIGKPNDNEVISGMRSSCEVIVEVNMAKAISDGVPFYVSNNKVILCPGDDKGALYPKYFRSV